VVVGIKMAEMTLYLAALAFMAGSILVIVGALLVEAYPKRHSLYFLPAGGALLIAVSFFIYQEKVNAEKEEALKELKRTKFVEKLYTEAKVKQTKCLNQLKECLEKTPTFEAGECFDGAENCCRDERFKEEAKKTCIAYLESTNPDLLADAKIGACVSLIKDYGDKLYADCKNEVRKAFLEKIKGGGNEGD